MTSLTTHTCHRQISSYLSKLVGTRRSPDGKEGLLETAKRLTRHMSSGVSLKKQTQNHGEDGEDAIRSRAQTSALHPQRSGHSRDLGNYGGDQGHLEQIITTTNPLGTGEKEMTIERLTPKDLMHEVRRLMTDPFAVYGGRLHPILQNGNALVGSRRSDLFKVLWAILNQALLLYAHSLELDIDDADH